MAYKVAAEGGHGRYTPGKRSPNGEREWFFNALVVEACLSRLKSYGIQTLRLDDPTGGRDVPLGERTNKANRWGADVLVSIHHNANAGVWGSHTGTETYTYLGDQPKSTRLAKCVHPRLVKAMGLRDRGIKKANFHMVRESNMPAILTEGGYMDSTIDIKRMRNTSIMKGAGIAIADGIAEYFGIKTKNSDPIAKGWLEEGDYGSSVGDLQRKLNKLGYNLAVDNSYGPATSKAVSHFQKNNGLKVDGFFGPNTQKALDSFLDRIQKKPPVKEEDEMEKTAVVIYGEADFAAGKRLADRLNCGVFSRYVAEKRQVAEKIYVVGGTKEGIKGEDKILLSGEGFFETMEEVGKQYGKL